MNKSLRARIRKVIASYSGPVTYVQIEAEVPRQPKFELALELCRMQTDGVLFFSAPQSYVRSHPVYSLTPFKRQPKYPPRPIAVEVEDEKAND